jgi:magnesium-transporting ATPase (P-type)
VAWLGRSGTGNELTPGKEIKDEHLLFTIAGCHSRVYPAGQQAADPMELAALEGINWAYSKGTFPPQPRPPNQRGLTVSCGGAGEVAVPRKGSSQRNVRVRVVRRFHFTSELKRMSAIVALDHETPAPLLAVAKVPPPIPSSHVRVLY